MLITHLRAPEIGRASQNSNSEVCNISKELLRSPTPAHKLSNHTHSHTPKRPFIASNDAVDAALLLLAWGPRKQAPPREGVRESRLRRATFERKLPVHCAAALR